MNIVRTLTIFMALAALSFVLGFFVLARLIPGAKPGSASVANPQDSLADRSIPPANAPKSTAQPAPDPALISSALPAEPATIPAKHTAVPGPSLDPVNDGADAHTSPAVQKPHKLETVATRSPAPTPADGSATTTGVKKPEPVRATPPEEAPPVARPRKHRATPRVRTADTSDSSDSRESASEATTPRILIPHKARPRHVEPASDSSDESDTAPAKPRARFREASNAGTGLFHVHLGAFHSRDAAVSEVERARAKGFTAQIVPMTRNGRTLFRVQAGAFRDRGRAESVQQSLQEANLDARITDQQR